MKYHAIGLMSGSSLDGLDLVCVELERTEGKWKYKIKGAETTAYPKALREELKNAAGLSAEKYCQLDVDFGHYLGRQVARFRSENTFCEQMDVVGSHGHTVFHNPEKGYTSQIGNGAALAAETGLRVVSDLRDLDLAFGGEGAPLVPLGEHLLYSHYTFFLNIGGIANISFHSGEKVLGYDVCPANRVLNILAGRESLDFDENGKLAAKGKVHAELLKALNEQPFYTKKPPKSLANEFGSEVLLGIIDHYDLPTTDKLRTFVAHIAFQIGRECERLLKEEEKPKSPLRMMATGGGAFNAFLIKCITDRLKEAQISVEIPDKETVEYKEAVIMALLGVLRWRGERTVLPAVTGARRASVGGALWIGGDGL